MSIYVSFRKFLFFLSICVFEIVGSIKSCCAPFLSEFWELGHDTSHFEVRLDVNLCQFQTVSKFQMFKQHATSP